MRALAVKNNPRAAKRAVEISRAQAASSFASLSVSTASMKPDQAGLRRARLSSHDASGDIDI